MTNVLAGEAEGYLQKLKRKVKVFNTYNNVPESNLKTNKSVHESSQHSIIQKGDITVCRQIGEGEFGRVYQAVWMRRSDKKKIHVAVKCMQEEKMRSSTLDFLQEVSIMQQIDNDYVVQLYGVVLEPHSVMLVTELAPLHSLLACLQDPVMRTSFPVLLLCEYALQIATGMAYLESHRLIHRDLACRNVLVFRTDQVKISDFGLSRALGAGEDYYRSNLTEGTRLPIAWCAPESINYLKFTSSSDVWSFGVTVWEMFSYGIQPWYGCSGQQVLAAIDRPHSRRLDKPDACPQEYYSLLLDCWQHDASKRPDFAHIRDVTLPDIKPERVQAICDCSDSSVGALNYKMGDIITVLSKCINTHSNNMSMWSGILNDGRCGLFDPSKTVTFLGTPAQLPGINARADVKTTNFKIQPVVLLQDSTAHAADKPVKLKRNMIGAPQDDFRHISHVGPDGQTVSPCQALKTSDKPTSKLVNSSATSPMANSVAAPPLPPKKGQHKSVAPLPPAKPKRLGGTPPRYDEKPTPLSGENKLSDIEPPKLGFERSLLEDIIGSLGEITGVEQPAVPTTQSEHVQADNTGAGNSSSRVGSPDTNRVTRYSYRREGSGADKEETTCSASCLRPVTATEAKLLDNVTHMASKLAGKAMAKEARIIEEAATASDSSPSSSPSGRRGSCGAKLLGSQYSRGPPIPDGPEVEDAHDLEPGGLVGRFKRTLRRSKRDNEPQLQTDVQSKQGFTDMTTESLHDHFNPDAAKAYCDLVENLTVLPDDVDTVSSKASDNCSSSPQSRMQISEPTAVVRHSECPVAVSGPVDLIDPSDISIVPSDDEDNEVDNPLRLLRDGGGLIVRSFRAGSGRAQAAPIRIPPPIPPKPRLRRSIATASPSTGYNNSASVALQNLNGDSHYGSRASFQSSDAAQPISANKPVMEFEGSARSLVEEIEQLIGL